MRSPDSPWKRRSRPIVVALSMPRSWVACAAWHFDDDARMAFHAEAAGDGEATHSPCPSGRAAGGGAGVAPRGGGPVPAGRAVLVRRRAGVRGWTLRRARGRAVVDRPMAGRRGRHCSRAGAVALGRRPAARGRHATPARGDDVGTRPWRRDGRRQSKPPWRPSNHSAAAASWHGPTGRWRSQRMLMGADDAAIEAAGRAQAIGEPLGVSDALIDALNTQGFVAASTGGDWLGPMHRALEMAIAGGFEDRAGLTFGNIHDRYCQARRFAEAERYYVDGLAYCDEHDITAAQQLAPRRPDHHTGKARALGRVVGPGGGGPWSRWVRPGLSDVVADEPRHHRSAPWRDRHLEPSRRGHGGG